MELLSLFIGLAFVLGFFILLVLTLVLASTFAGTGILYIFLKTRKIIVPKVSMFILNIAEMPLRYLLILFGRDDEVISNLIIDLRNILFRNQYESIDYPNRAIFIPQCLRHPECPAPLTSEGLKCVSCGRCGLGKVKEMVEGVGSLFFISPGSSLIKRMVKQYSPKAILGVGCHMEVKEGIEMVIKYNLPVQGVKLKTSGCVDTRVDVSKLVELIYAHETHKPHYDIFEDSEMMVKVEELERLWVGFKGWNFKVLKEEKHIKTV